MKPVIIDIFNGNRIDSLDALKDQGIVGIIHKASEGASITDASYERRRAWEKEGFLWGAYHFNSRLSSIAEQVENFLDSAKPDEKTLLCLDWEGGPNQALTASEAREFLNRLMKATKRSPSGIWIYGGNVLRERIVSESDKAFFGQFRLWHCQYATARPNICTAWKNYDLWQYSETGQLKGTGTLIDLNSVPGSIDELRAKWAPAYANAPAPSTSVPASKPAASTAPTRPAAKPTIGQRIKDWFWSH